MGSLEKKMTLRLQGSIHEPQCLISTSASEGDVSSLHKQTRRRFTVRERGRERERRGGERGRQTGWKEC